MSCFTCHVTNVTCHMSPITWPALYAAEVAMNLKVPESMLAAKGEAPKKKQGRGTNKHCHKSTDTHTDFAPKRMNRNRVRFIENGIYFPLTKEHAAPFFRYLGGSGDRRQNSKFSRLLCVVGRCVIFLSLNFSFLIKFS